MRFSIAAYVPQPSLLKKIDPRSSRHDEIGNPAGDDGQSLVRLKTFSPTLSLESLRPFIDVLFSIDYALRYACLGPCPACPPFGQSQILAFWCPREHSASCLAHLFQNCVAVMSTRAFGIFVIRRSPTRRDRWILNSAARNLAALSRNGFLEPIRQSD